MGAAAGAARAPIQLEATGGTARSSVPETASDLTPHEAQVARHVADGDTNREAAAKLFLSPPPSSTHLRKVDQSSASRPVRNWCAGSRSTDGRVVLQRRLLT